MKKAASKRLRKPGAFDLRAFLASGGPAKSLAEYQPSHKIFSQGEPCNAVYYVQTGRVKLTVVSKQGKEAVIAILGPEDFVTAACLAGQKIHMATATAIIPSSILTIQKNEMLRSLNSERELSAHFISYLLLRNRRIEEDLIDQLFNSGEKRLARALLSLADFGKEGASEAIIPDMNQETLAKMIGVTRERVNHLMNKFKKMGFVSYNGRLEIRSSLLDVIINE